MNAGEWRGVFSRRFGALALLAISMIVLAALPAAPVRAAGGVSIQVKDGQPQQLPPGGKTVLVVTVTPTLPAIADGLRECMAAGTDCPSVRVSSDRGKVTPGRLSIEELVISGGGNPNVPLRVEVTFVAGTEGGKATIKAEVLNKGRAVAAASTVVEIQGGEKAEALQISVSCAPGGAGLACSVQVLNPMKDESFIYNYWLGNNMVEMDLAPGARSSRTISAPDLDPGTYVLEVEVLGKDRSARKKVDFVISEDGDEGDEEPQTEPKDSEGAAKGGTGESLFEKGELDKIPGWDKLSPEVKQQLLEQAAKSRAKSGSGGSVPQVELPEPGAEREPGAEPMIRPDKVQQQIQKMKDDDRTIVREYDITLKGEDEYRQQKAVSDAYNALSAAKEKVEELLGFTDDPEQFMIDNFRAFYKDKATEAAKDLLQREGVISKNSPEPVSEVEFARAVYLWAQANSSEVTPIHYRYYRQEYESYIEARRSELPRVLQKGWTPSEKELALAHDHAIGRVRDRLTGRVPETFEADVTTRDYGQIGGSGKLGRSWDPKFLADDARMDAYDEAFPKINAKTSYP